MKADAARQHELVQEISRLCVGIGATSARERGCRIRSYQLRDLGFEARGGERFRRLRGGWPLGRDDLDSHGDSALGLGLSRRYDLSDSLERRDASYARGATNREVR